MRKSDNLPVTFTKSDVEIIARETRYRGFSLDVYRFRHRLFNGEMSGEVKREILSAGTPPSCYPLTLNATRWCWSNRFVLPHMTQALRRGCWRWSPA